MKSCKKYDECCCCVQISYRNNKKLNRSQSEVKMIRRKRNAQYNFCVPTITFLVVCVCMNTRKWAQNQTKVFNKKQILNRDKNELE